MSIKVRRPPMRLHGTEFLRIHSSHISLDKHLAPLLFCSNATDTVSCLFRGAENIYIFAIRFFSFYMLARMCTCVYIDLLFCSRVRERVAIDTQRHNIFFRDFSNDRAVFLHQKSRAWFAFFYIKAFRALYFSLFLYFFRVFSLCFKLLIFLSLLLPLLILHSK